VRVVLDYRCAEVGFSRAWAFNTLGMTVNYGISIQGLGFSHPKKPPTSNILDVLVDSGLLLSV
jgi:hypothetical protein